MAGDLLKLSKGFRNLPPSNIRLLVTSGLEDGLMFKGGRKGSRSLGGIGKDDEKPN